jgi:hypothetical protein
MNADVRPIPVQKPFLFLATEEHASGETGAREYIGSESNTYYVVVSGADHMSFTDAGLVSSGFTRDLKPDNSAFERALLTSILINPISGRGILRQEFESRRCPQSRPGCACR